MWAQAGRAARCRDAAQVRRASCWRRRRRRRPICHWAADDDDGSHLALTDVHLSGVLSRTVRYCVHALERRRRRRRFRRPNRAEARAPVGRELPSRRSRPATDRLRARARACVRKGLSAVRRRPKAAATAPTATATATAVRNARVHAQSLGQIIIIIITIAAIIILPKSARASSGGR